VTVTNVPDVPSNAVAERLHRQGRRPGLYINLLTIVTIGVVYKFHLSRLWLFGFVIGGGVAILWSFLFTSGVRRGSPLDIIS
jgi:hypothetical protein